jgi:hypothetical protein
LLLLQGPSLEQMDETVLDAGAVWRNRPGDVHTIEALEDSDVSSAAS